MASGNETSSRETRAERNDNSCSGSNNNNNNNDADKRDNNSDNYNDRSVNIAREERFREIGDQSDRSCRAPLVDWRDGSLSIYYDSSQDNADSKRSIDTIQTIETIQRHGVPSETQSKPETVNDSASVTGQKSRSNCSAQGEKRKKPKIPDGGWGWIVVLASLGVSAIADGVSFSFGLLYIEFLRAFGASKSKTAWIGSLFMAVPLLSGPIMSALVDRYGCRSMTILGGLISGLGFALSSFVNNIEIMFLTFGVISGLGLGLCYVTMVVSVAYWFEKRRTLAVGLGACGSGIGTFLYAPMTTYFIREYGWRGTCLLLAGTFFNMIVFGTVMRDPEWLIWEQRENEQARKSHVRLENAKLDDSPSDEFPGVEELRRDLLRSDHVPEYLAQNLDTIDETADGENKRVAFKSVIDLPTFIKQKEKVPLEVFESLLSNFELHTAILKNHPSLLQCRSLSDKQLQDLTETMKSKANTNERRRDSRRLSVHASTKFLWTGRVSRKETEEISPLLTKETAHMVASTERTKSVCRHNSGDSEADGMDSLFWHRRRSNSYFRDIITRQNSVMYRGSLNLHNYKLRASSCPNIYRNSITLVKEDEPRWYDELVDMLKGMLDFSMFLNLHFLLLSLSTILLFTWFIVPYFYLAEHLTRNGYNEADAANFLSIIGLTNTIGMIALGWAGDQPWMNVSKTYAWCLVVCGVATIFISLFTHYIFLVVSSATFGLFFASCFSFMPVLLVELISLERFTTALGLSLLCQGIGNLLGPPLAGWLFDMTGSWQLSFFMAGGWIIFSGVLVGVIPYTRNRKILGSGSIETTHSSDNEMA